MIINNEVVMRIVKEFRNRMLAAETTCISTLDDKVLCTGINAFKYGAIMENRSPELSFIAS